MKKITNEQREAIVRKAVAGRDSLLNGKVNAGCKEVYAHEVVRFKRIQQLACLEDAMDDLLQTRAAIASQSAEAEPTLSMSMFASVADYKAAKVSQKGGQS